MVYERRFPEVSAALFDALADDPFYVTLAAAAPPGESARAMIDYIDYSLVEAERHGILCLADGGNPGASAWHIPLDAELSQRLAVQKNAFIAEEMGAACLETYIAVSGFMHEATLPFVHECSWYLSIIGVAPRLQGKGAGRRMLIQVLQQADEAGVPTYLETFTPRNIPFYSRLGYREAAEIPEPRTNSRYMVMIRDPIQ